MNDKTALERNFGDVGVFPEAPTTKVNVQQTAQYISDMVLELRNMAKAAELKTLQGLLEVCFYESFSVANKVEIPPEDLARLTGKG